MVEARLDPRNSLVYWFPRVSGLGVPVPRTVVVPIPHDDDRLYTFVEAGTGLEDCEEKIRAAAGGVGYPLFVRTDLASGKHDWKRSCFVERPDDLIEHIRRVVEFNFLAGGAGLPCRALVFREYVPLRSLFTAFRGEMPVAAERRYFVRDGRVECRHPYWPEEAIRQPSAVDWRDRLREMNRETGEEVALLTGYARRIGAVLGGYWSLDFALARGGAWYFLDAALGECSWHPAECPKVPGREGS